MLIRTSFFTNNTAPRSNSKIKNANNLTGPILDSVTSHTNSTSGVTGISFTSSTIPMMAIYHPDSRNPMVMTSATDSTTTDVKNVTAGVSDTSGQPVLCLPTQDEKNTDNEFTVCASCNCDSSNCNCVNSFLSPHECVEFLDTTELTDELNKDDESVGVDLDMVEECYNGI